MKKSNYSENWQDTIRPLVLKRDNYKCKICKVKHRSIGYYDSSKSFVECDEHMQEFAKKHNIKLIKIILQVHHINCNKLDNDMDNLKTVCAKCHFKEDKNMNILKRKMKGIIYPK